MIDARCLLCGKNSTRLAYELFGGYPAVCQDEGAQAMCATIVDSHQVTGVFMLAHFVYVHGISAHDVANAEYGDKGFTLPNGTPFMEVVNLSDWMAHLSEKHEREDKYEGWGGRYA